VYHLRSNHPTRVDTFEEYGDTHMVPPPAKADPWAPFSSRADFEFTEIVLAAGLTSKQVDLMINIIGHVSEGSDCKGTPLTAPTHPRIPWPPASHPQCP